tara:strand:- start:17607 stop:18386 length:780 start_codon:yes stop_codon:yes gene_type:complete
MTDSDNATNGGKLSANSNPISLAGKLAAVFREHGLSEGVGVLIHYGVDRAADAWFGIGTRRCVNLAGLGYESEDFVDYAPITYWAFWIALNRCRIVPEDVFVDFGVGRGRCLVVAGTRRFRKVIGVELVPELAQQARSNMELARKRLRCKSWEVVETNAEQFSIPAESTILHFYNPFRGPTLDRVIVNLADSLRNHPRQITVLFGNPDDFQRILNVGEPIPESWVKQNKIVKWPGYRPNDDLLGNLYRVYKIDSTKAET